MKKIQAFTLIELLIVVAIIAILAAIAVPNFLEAQTRSKVSRVKADMRSIKTAMEAYRIDNNTYVRGRACDNIFANGYPEGPLNNRGVLLTTPVAYMTSIPNDPFHTVLGSLPTTCDKPGFVLLHQQYHRWYNPNTGGYGWRLGGALGAINAWDPEWVYWPQGMDPQWVLISKGPSREKTIDIYAIPYDPSNGTISIGEIVTWGPG
jgi:type II secretion system protein G